MQDTLREIREYLRQNAYLNEEHVRLALVCRVLRELGWDIWNPREVCAEFVPNRSEDNTKVDLALFIKNDIPAVFIEAKAVGKMDVNLHKIEEQVRDYNRNNTALFSIITDGRKWRFYYSQTGGEFHQKCFKQFDFLKDELDGVEDVLRAFLTKESLSGDAEIEAKKYLQLTKLEKAIQDCSPEADRYIQRPPWPTKPEAIVTMLREQWPGLTEEQVEKHLLNVGASLPKGDSTPSQDRADKRRDRRVGKSLPGNLGVDFRHAEMRGTIMGQTTKGWNPFLRKVVALALDEGHEIQFLNSKLSVSLKEGTPIDEHHAPIREHNAYLQLTGADRVYKSLSQLARILRRRIDLEMVYRKQSPRAGKTINIRVSDDGKSSIV